MGPWAAPSKFSKTLGLPHPKEAHSWGTGPSLILCPRLQQLDEENSELRSCTPCLKANIERLEEVSYQQGMLSQGPPGWPACFSIPSGSAACWGIGIR